MFVANSAVSAGIIGLGGRGSSHARHISGLPRARLVSVAGVSVASIEKARGRVSLDDVLEEKSPHDITMDALGELFGRILSDKRANTGVRGAESTPTALLCELAIAERAEVTWDEMMSAWEAIAERLASYNSKRANRACGENQ